MIEKNYKMSNSTDPLSEETDVKCCNSPHLEYKDGQQVCINCGMINGIEYTSAGKRAYTPEEVRSRSRNEPTWRNFGPRTLLPKKQYDGKGKKMKMKEMTLFNRLSKINNSLISSIERNFWDAKPKVKMIATKLNLPRFIRETGWRIYAESAKQKLTMGRSIEGFVAAALYAAIRIHEFPKLLDEVTEATSCKRRSVHRCLALVVKDVLPKLGLSYKPITPHQLVFRFGNDLYLNITIQKKAANLLTLAIKNGLPRIGKDPRGLAASVLYLAAKSSEDRRTQKEISLVAKITEVTLRSRAKEIRAKI